MLMPQQIFAGDSLAWTESLAGYSAADGWTLRYVLVSPSAQLSIVSAADGSNHRVSVPATTTAGWGAGGYSWQAYVAHSDGSRITIGEGHVTVRPNLAAQGSGMDTRSHAKMVLDAIEATILNKGTKGQLSIEVSGIRLEQYKMDELLMLRDRYKSEYLNEVAAARLANGGAPRGRILVRFS